MERVIKDMFGKELKVGDSICFTLSIRKDQKPIVKARIGDFAFAKTCNKFGEYRDFIIIDCYVETTEVKWARKEDKLIEKVISSRVVKCY